MPIILQTLTLVSISSHLHFNITLSFLHGLRDHLFSLILFGYCPTPSQSASSLYYFLEWRVEGDLLSISYSDNPLLISQQTHIPHASWSSLHFPMVKIFTTRLIIQISAQTSPPQGDCLRPSNLPNLSMSPQHCHVYFLHRSY